MRPAIGWTNAALRAVLALGIAAFVLLTLIGLTGIVYDNQHFGDTSFIFGAAWRVYTGMQPGIDFGHFYGGFTSGAIALAMHLFGPTMHAWAQAALMLFAAAWGIAIAICWRHVSATIWLSAGLLLAALLFTLHPLEVSQSVTRIWSAHSFLYNRIGLAQAILCALFVAFRSETRRREAATGLLLGIVCVAAAYTKPTFVILALALPLALIVQRRWSAILGVGLGMVGTLALFDPDLRQYRASWNYVQASVGTREDSEIVSLIRKSVQILLAQPVAVTLLAAALMAAWRILRFGPATVAGLAIVFAAATGMAATMGGGGSLGQMALPLICAAAICLAGIAADGLSLRSFPMATSLVLLAAFGGPHLLNLAGATAEARQFRDAPLIATGPYAAYHVTTDNEDANSARQYAMLADGLEALAAMGAGADTGIVADNGVSFEFAMLARPVGGFPLWPRPNSPEFAGDPVLDPAIDVVLLAHAPTEIRAVLRDALPGAFDLCRRTVYWNVYTRRGARWATCTAS
ncbi:hypothetical protein OCGS_1681 [Oceaniovalibus guishaninsula JLT2003]|uniref:Glycosyltransferase RgtA/B/C/D-like domain-containing protein n=1 Tax=Oceaniovalibus guishaninsula JLT2003 TaxID=1231392 RepID=K2I5J3_9RHOB|nr:hypothetical protein [Oceaniovalibus guishaninsula]EKE44165.1 hypothetical protein OCGS_1681 [Oceaniovalibus guishaninsula JLT2003]